MARYIDVEKIPYYLDTSEEAPMEGRMIAYKSDIDKFPTADVAPKSEDDRLEYTLLGVMHSVDKWLDGEELEQDEVNRAITMREKTLRIIENLKSDIVSGVMKEVRQTLLNMVLANSLGKNYDIEGRFAEIEKKYTEV